MSTFAVWTLVILFGTLFLCMIAFRWPVFLSMLMACVVWGIVFPGKLPDSTIVSSIQGGINSTTYVAIIFYFLLGELINRSSLGDRLCGLLTSITGHIPGSLSHVNVLDSMIFAGVSGSSVADTASVGAMMIPMMKKEGYPAGYAAAITEVSSLIGPIIPPSNGFVMCAVIMGISVRRLFLGGVIPGVFLGLAMLAMSYFLSIKYKVPRRDWCGWKHVFSSFYHGFGALALPLITMICLFFGIGTVVEIGAITCIAAVIILIVYREFKIKTLFDALLASAVAGAKVMCILCVTGIFTFILASSGVIGAMSSAIGSLNMSAAALGAFCMLVFFILGFILDPSVLINVIIPVMLPALVATGVDLIWFSVVVIMTINLGNITPPVGQLIYLTSSLADCSAKETIKASIPYFLLCTGVIIVLIIIPQIVTFLPDMIMG